MPKKERVFTQKNRFPRPFQKLPPTAPLDVLQVQKELKSVTVEDWQSAWAGKMENFWEKQPAKRCRKKTTASQDGREREATLLWMLDMSHAMNSFGKRWRSFSHEEDALREPLSKRPKVAVICTDQESTQLAAMSYLVHAKKLCILHVFDPIHRSHNDQVSALQGAGLMKFSMWCHLCFNIKYGPYSKGGWAKKMVEAAEMLETLDPNDQLLQYFFSSILADKNLTEDSNTEAFRKEFLRGLTEEPCVRSKGPKASTSRFNSLSLAHRALDQQWSTQAFILSALCIIQGWATTVKDLFGEDVPHGSVADAYLTKTKARAAAKQEMNRERKKTANSLHMMCRWMCNPDHKASARMIFFAMQPESVSIGRVMKELRGAEKTLSHYSEAAHWSWMSTAVQHVRVMSDLQILERIGFNMSLVQAKSASDSELQWEDSWAEQMWTLVHMLLLYRGGSQLFYTSGAGSSAGLVHGDEGKVMSSLVFLKSCCETAAAVQRSGSRQAQSLLAGHFSTTCFAKWVFQVLSAVDFAAVPAALSDLLREVWSSPLNSKLVEDENKIHREMETRATTSIAVKAMSDV